MRFLCTALCALALTMVPSMATAQYPCNEACEQQKTPEGEHRGYACVVGTQGDGCQATVNWCQITVGGCPGGEMEQEAINLTQATVTDFPSYFRAGFFTSDIGVTSYVAVSCDVSAIPLLLPRFAVVEVVESRRVPGALD